MDDKVMATGKIVPKKKLKSNPILQGLSIKF
jgi:hypothetical protein